MKLARLLNPWTISLIAFFPLLSLQGGVAGLWPPVTPRGLQRRSTTLAPSRPLPERGQPFLAIPRPTDPQAGAPNGDGSPKGDNHRGNNQGSDGGPNDLERDRPAGEWTPSVEQLKAWGATYVRLERRSAQAVEYGCYCEVPLDGASGTVRPYWACGPSPTAAVGDVIRQIRNRARARTP